MLQPLHPATGASLHNERIIAVREEPKLHPESSEMSHMECGRHLNKVQPVVELGLHSFSIEACERNVLSGFRVHSSITKSEASALIDFTTRSAKKLMVEPSAIVGLGLNSDVIHDVSYDSLFTALELSAFESWLVRPGKESNCKVTDCGSHVQRVLGSMAECRNTLCLSMQRRLTSPSWRVWCVFVCHPHLTSTICCAAVWAQACGLECKTGSVFITHLWIIRRHWLFSLSLIGVLVKAVPRYCYFWERLFGPSQPRQSCLVCVLVNTLQYHDTVGFVKGSETEDPQLVAEPGVGRNHGEAMGTS